MENINEQKLLYYRSKTGQFAKIIYYTDDNKKDTASFKGKLVKVLDDRLIIENILTKQSGTIEIISIKHDLFEPLKSNRGQKI
jgi:hypothetical protein